MPYKASSPHRPWTSKPTLYNNIPGQGRYHISGFYKTPEWRKIRLEHIMINPLCVECKKEGIIKTGNTVDHIKPVNQKDPWDIKNGKYGEPLDLDNLQTLCEHHHAIKSAKEKWNK